MAQSYIEGSVFSLVGPLLPGSNMNTVTLDWNEHRSERFYGHMKDNDQMVGGLLWGQVGSAVVVRKG